MLKSTEYCKTIIESYIFQTYVADYKCLNGIQPNLFSDRTYCTTVCTYEDMLILKTIIV